MSGEADAAELAIVSVGGRWARLSDGRLVTVVPPFHLFGDEPAFDEAVAAFQAIEKALEFVTSRFGSLAEGKAGANAAAALARLATRLDEQEKALRGYLRDHNGVIAAVCSCRHCVAARSALGTGGPGASQPKGSVSSSPGEGEPRDG